MYFNPLANFVFVSHSEIDIPLLINLIQLMGKINLALTVIVGN